MTRRSFTLRLHAVAGSIAFLTVLTFFTSTAIVEAVGDPAAVARVKQAIAWALLLLVPALMVTGGTGFAMAGGRPGGLAGAKLGRMRIVAANGVLVLVPAALFLAWKAGAGEFDRPFVLVQAIEFAAGGANLLLMGLNIRDGLTMTGRLRPRSTRVPG